MGSSEQLDLTIVIVNYNTAELVCACIESLPRGIERYSYSVVVVDNGSVDNSVQAIRERFSGVTVIENGKNLGFAAANNIGMDAVQSRYYLLLNSDTLMCAGSVDRVLDFMEKTPDAGFASPQLLNADGSLQNTAANFPTLATELGNKSLLRLLWPSRYYQKRFVAQEPLAVESLVGAALFARAEMCREVGRYDAGYFFFIEETEWCWRACKAGWRSYLVPEADIYHLQGQTAKKVPLAVRIEYWRSRYKFFRDHSSGVTFGILLAGLLCKNTLNMLLNLVAAPFSVKSRHKFRLAVYIFKWHVLGCPQEMGLSGK